MPITNGLQFLRLVRSKPHLVDVPVAIVTGDYFLAEADPARAEIARRVDPVQAAVARRSDRARQDPGLGVNDRFLRACRRQPVDATPVWFMRQAGRYMPDYRALRAALLAARDLPRTRARRRGHAPAGRRSSTSTRRSCFPICCVPFTPMGLDFDFVKGEGPSIEQPDPRRRRRRSAAIASSRARRWRTCSRPSGCCAASWTDRVPLIGFGGAPFTLAAYAIEGGPSTTYARTKAFMYAQPAAWHRLCERFADMMADYLRRRSRRARRRCRSSIRGRARSAARDYREFALPHTSPHLRALARLRRAADPFRRRHRARSSGHRRSRRRRHRRRLAAAARRGVGRDRPRPRDPGQPRSGAAARPARSAVRRGRRHPAPRRRTARATSSISATACCRARRSRPCRRSRATFTKSSRVTRSRNQHWTSRDPDSARRLT